MYTIKSRTSLEFARWYKVYNKTGNTINIRYNMISLIHKYDIKMSWYHCSVEGCWFVYPYICHAGVFRLRC